MANLLPDEIWREIFKTGIEKSKFNYKDLCCISISCKRLNKLSNENIFWSNLLTLDFPLSTLHRSSLHLQLPHKDLYKVRFEREKERKFAAHRRAVLRIESQISVHSRNLEGLRRGSIEENKKMKEVVKELVNLEKVRSASVALNVWQPEIIRGKQKGIVEQCVVPVEFRISAIEMEIRVCKQQIKVFDKAYRDEKLRLDKAKKQLRSMNYHPLRDCGLAETMINGSKKESQHAQMKKSKHWIDFEDCAPSSS